MRRSTLELLACPTCHTALSLGNGHGPDPVVDGTLFCPACERTYPVKNGIPHFVDPQDLEGSNRRFARFYDRFSPVYGFFTRMALLPFGGDRKARKEILDRLELNGGRILEVSIGTGVNLPYLFESAPRGEIYGLDLSAGQLARCHRLVAKQGWPVDLFLGTAEALPFQADTFDSVFHIGGINFFSDKRRAIEEMIRVARPGTKIAIADEAERLAQLYHRIPGSSREAGGQPVDTAVPAHLVPDTMEDIRLDGIWHSHGKPHGYCLEFRKPA